MDEKKQETWKKHKSKDGDAGKVVLMIVSLVGFILIAPVLIQGIMWGVIAQSVQNDQEEANRIQSIYESRRNENTSKGNSLIHSQYKSLKEFAFDGLEIRYLGHKDGHFMFELFNKRDMDQIANYKIYDENKQVVSGTSTSLDGECSEGKDKDGKIKIERFKPTIMCMESESPETTPFSYFGGESYNSLRSNVLGMTRIDGKEVTHPQQTDVFGEERTLDVIDGKEVRYKYEKTEYVEIEDHGATRSLTLIYTTVTVPENTSQERIKESLGRSTIHRIYGNYQWFEKAVDSYTISDFLVLPQGVETQTTLNAMPFSSKSGQSFTFVRVFNTNKQDSNAQLIDTLGKQQKNKKVFNIIN